MGGKNIAQYSYSSKTSFTENETELFPIKQILNAFLTIFNNPV